MNAKVASYFNYRYPEITAVFSEQMFEIQRTCWKHSEAGN